MIRYRYVQSVTPPAPFVTVSLRCPATGQAASDLPAQIDTAADRTVLTEEIVEALGLVEDDRLLFQGFAGEVVELPIFLVEIRIGDLDPHLIRAALGPGETHVLLGRDVLNRHDVLLKGAQQALEISVSSS